MNGMADMYVGLEEEQMTNEITKVGDQRALAKSISDRIQQRIDGLQREVQQADQMTPYQMQQMLVRITGALESIAQNQQQILRALEVQGANNICR